MDFDAEPDLAKSFAAAWHSCAVAESWRPVAVEAFAAELAAAGPFADSSVVAFVAGLAFAFVAAWLFVASSAVAFVAAFAESSAGLELVADTSVAFVVEACAYLAQERRNRFVENSFVAADS